MSYSTESIKLHKKHKGKIKLQSKVPLKNKKDLSIAYTPGVAGVCLEIFRSPKIALQSTLKANTVAIISDGSAVLGLGNLGALAAIPVMEGKAVLFKEFADIDAFPICLDTQNTEEIIRIVKAIAPVFGGINLEDIAAPKCFEIEARLKKELSIPVMHDDQHGTAVVVLAGLINAIKLRKSSVAKVKIVINGAGAAGNAITNLLLAYGFKNIVVCDSRGMIYSGRKNMDSSKKQLAKVTNHKRLKGDLSEVLLDADVFIGVSTGSLLNKQLIKTMNARPIIFALANPIPEIMPDQAKLAGSFIVATGRSDFPNQINNVLAFPGIFRGALDNGVRIITQKMLLKAAINLAKTVKNPTVNHILPDVFDKQIVKNVAKAIKLR